MFTVIICSDVLYKNCTKKYYEFLTPFLRDGDFAFCSWNPYANTLDEAVPQLQSLLEDKGAWRALIVLDGESYGYNNISKRNPFNYIDSDNELVELHTSEEIFAFRKKCRDLLNQAINNPLVKLGIWLTGASSSEYPVVPDEYSTLPDPSDGTYFDELRERRISALEVELERFTELKGRVLSENFAIEGQMQKKPTQVIALSERKHVNDNSACNSAWKMKQEHAYSRFFEDNLYAGRMRFLISDVDYVNNQRNENSYFNFLLLVLLLARINSASEAIRQGKVYSVGIKVNKERLSEGYYAYLNKLRATLQKINVLKRKKLSEQNEPINNKLFEELFISDVFIPVEVSNEFDNSSLFCIYKGLGFSRDCPRDERDFWDTQYHEIEKKFIRYLREPRRAIKTSVNEDFRNQNEIQDARIASLNEFQKEEVIIRLLDEEEAMINTKTTQLFKSKEFTQLMEEADKILRRRIGQRMTKKKTVVIGYVAILTYLIGFLPLFLSNVGSSKEFLFSLLLTSISIFLFGMIGLVCLWVLRRRLINCFKHFNYVMSGILSEIEGGLKGFANYLSHCCNVMREFSVLKWLDIGRDERISIIKKHEYYILQQLKEAQSFFNGSITEKVESISDVTPYDFDYTKDEIYQYEMGSVIKSGKCKFLQEDNVVEIPVDYIEAITLTREELYD